jgi:hypothetical protein
MADHFLGQFLAGNRRIRNRIWLRFDSKIFW